MKKPLDIGALIDEKLKTKSNKFGWAELLEEIDSVLMEQGPYSSKLVPGNIENLEENPRDPGNAKQIAHHAGISGDPRNPISNADMGFIPAEKLAETSVSSGGSSRIQTKKFENIEMPDFFSLITNSEMKLSPQDKDIIDGIAKKIPGNSWEEKLISFENMYIANARNEIDLSNIDMEEAVSKMIYFNVLKKISQYTAQPGKLFEYVLTPLISEYAQVLGSTDTDIIDITEDLGGGKVNNYSAKFFTGQVSRAVFEGSYDNLNKFCNSTPNKPVALEYVVGKVEEQKNLIFTKFFVSTNENYFVTNGYTKVAEHTAWIAYEKSGQKGLGVYIRSESDKNTESAKRAAAAASKKEEPQNIKDLRAQINNLENKIKNSKISLDPNELIAINYGGVKKTASKKEWVEFNKQFEPIKNTSDLQAEINKTSSDKWPRSFYKEIFTNVGDISKTYDILKGFKDSYKDAAEKALQQKEKNNTDVNRLLTDLKQKQEQLQTELDKYQQAISQIPGSESEQQSITEQLINEGDSYRFAFPMAGVISKYKFINIDLGSLASYNKWQLKIAQGLQESVFNTIEQFSQLGRNMTQYFTGQGGTGREMHGVKAITNAENIASNIKKVGTEKGDFKK